MRANPRPEAQLGPVPGAAGVRAVRALRGAARAAEAVEAVEAVEAPAAEALAASAAAGKRRQAIRTGTASSTATRCAWVTTTRTAPFSGAASCIAIASTARGLP